MEVESIRRSNMIATVIYWTLVQFVNNYSYYTSETFSVNGREILILYENTCDMQYPVVFKFVLIIYSFLYA